MKIVKMSPEDLIPSLNPNYVEVGLLPLINDLAWMGDAVILKGPKGSGKTLAVETWCAQNEIPMIRENCNVGTDEMHLIGSFGLEGETVYFTLGSLPLAIETANEVGAAVLVLEEINTLRPQVQSMVFSVADYRKAVETASLGRKFSLKPEAQLFVVGTMNPGYSGTYQLNEALRSRFDFVEVGYMPEAQERKMLELALSPTPAVAERQLASRLVTLAQESRSGTWDYALSTRDLMHTVRKIQKLGLERGLRMLVNKFETEHHPAIFGRVQSIFAVNITGVKIYAV
jgi:MoxR-like ATPase